MSMKKNDNIYRRFPKLCAVWSDHHLDYEQVLFRCQWLELVRPDRYCMPLQIFFPWILLTCPCRLLIWLPMKNKSTASSQTRINVENKINAKSPAKSRTGFINRFYSILLQILSRMDIQWSQLYALRYTFSSLNLKTVVFHAINKDKKPRRCCSGKFW